mgnify:CR=1 FL=1|jgi:uncharacterized protein (TIGR02466 family)
MINDPQVVQLFSQPLAINQIATDKFDKISNAASDTIMDSVNAGHNNGQMSDTQWLLTQPEVKTIVEQHLSAYVFGVLAIDEKKHYLQHTSSWVNKHVPGDNAQGHSHSNAMFSGVLYFKVPPNSGSIIFHLPALFPTFCTQTLYPEVREYNEYNMREATINPVTGMILCFPSHLPHSVAENLSNEDRYSMAFNYILRGEYGEKDHYLKL